MATTFPEIGVQAVLRDFYIFQRDINSYNRLISNAIGTATGATSSLSSAQNLAAQAALAASQADQDLAIAYQREAQAAQLADDAANALTKAHVIAAEAAFERTTAERAMIEVYGAETRAASSATEATDAKAEADKAASVAALAANKAEIALNAATEDAIRLAELRVGAETKVAQALAAEAAVIEAEKAVIGKQAAVQATLNELSMTGARTYAANEANGTRAIAALETELVARQELATNLRANATNYIDLSAQQEKVAANSARNAAVLGAEAEAAAQDAAAARGLEATFAGEAARASNRMAQLQGVAAIIEENAAAREADAAAAEAHTTALIAEANAERAEAEAAAQRAEVSVTKAGVLGAQAGAAATAEQASGAMAAVMGMVAAIGLASVAAVKLGADYESSMVRLQTATRLSNDQMQPFIATNTELAGAFGETSNASARLETELARDLAQEEKGTAIMQNATKAAIELSKATGSDLSASAKLVSTSINAFSMNAAGAAHTADVWDVALQNSNLDARTAYASFQNLSNATKSMGLSFEQTAALMTTVAQRGDALSRAGLDLSRVFSSIVNPSATAAKILNDHQIVMRDAATGAINFTATLQRLETVYGSTAIAAGQMTAETRNQELAIITGQSGVRVFGGELDGLSSSFDRNTRAMQVNGTALRDAKANTDTLAGTWDKLKASLADSFALIGAGNSGPLKGFIQLIQTTITDAQEAEERYNATRKAQDQLNLSWQEAKTFVDTYDEYIKNANLHQIELAGSAGPAASGVAGVGNSANAAAGQVENYAAALRDAAQAQLELAKAEASNTADQIGVRAIEAQGRTGVAEATGLTPDKVQDAKNQAAAITTAANNTYQASTIAAQGAHDRAIALAQDRYMKEVHSLGDTADAYANYNTKVEADTVKANSILDAANAEAADRRDQSIAQGEARVREAEDAKSRSAGGGAAKDARAADSAAQAQILSTDKVRDTFIRDFTEMSQKADDDFKKMAASYKENVANAIARETETLAADEARIAEAQQAEEIRRSEDAERRALQEKIQMQRDAFDAQRQMEQDAFDFQERLIRDNLADQQQAERDAFDLQQEAIDKKVDAATVAATKGAMGTAEQNQLANPNLNAKQKAQIQADYATNQKLYQQQVDATNATIQLDAKKNAAKEAFDAKLRVESENADDAALKRRETQSDKFRTEQEAFDKKVQQEELDLDAKFQQAALDRQITSIRQQEKNTRNASVLELDHMKTVYDNEVTARQQALARDEANLILHFNQEMSEFEAHWSELERKQIAHDATVAAQEAKLTRFEIDNANVAIEAFNKMAQARALALGIAVPNAVATIDPSSVTPANIPVGHDGAFIGGLPGTERMIRALAGEMVIQPASLGLSPSNNYNANTTNNNWAFHANYSAAQQPNELRHDIMAIMALTRGGR